MYGPPRSCSVNLRYDYIEGNYMMSIKPYYHLYLSLYVFFAKEFGRQAVLLTNNNNLMLYYYIKQVMNGKC